MAILSGIESSTARSTYFHAQDALLGAGNRTIPSPHWADHAAGVALLIFDLSYRFTTMRKNRNSCLKILLV